MSKVTYKKIIIDKEFDLKISKVIFELYKLTTTFECFKVNHPNRNLKAKLDIYSTIETLSTCLYRKMPEIDEILGNIERDCHVLREEIKKDSLSSIRGTKKIYESKQDNSKLTSDYKFVSKHRLLVNRRYYNEILCIINQMNTTLSSDCPDTLKIKWLYNYVYNLKFDHNYGRYRTSGVLNPDLATENYFSDAEQIKFGIFDKYNLVFGNKIGVCTAHAQLFSDLCLFAGLKNDVILPIYGNHCGEGHAWNYSINSAGTIFYFDASFGWHQNNSQNIQYRLPERYTISENNIMICGWNGYIPKASELSFVSSKYRKQVKEMINQRKQNNLVNLDKKSNHRKI